MTQPPQTEKIFRAQQKRARIIPPAPSITYARRAPASTGTPLDRDLIGPIGELPVLNHAGDVIAAKMIGHIAHRGRGQQREVRAKSAANAPDIVAPKRARRA